MWKFSQTLLRMLGFTFDIIIMQEVVGGKARIDPATCKRVLEHTAGFFEQFLAQYVEGRVGVRPQVPESESEVLTDRLRRWLASATAGGRPPLCLMGEGGSGKTSAAIALCARVERAWVVVMRVCLLSCCHIIRCCTPERGACRGAAVPATPFQTRP